jgi:hypothetical protein
MASYKTKVSEKLTVNTSGTCTRIPPLLPRHNSKTLLLRLEVLRRHNERRSINPPTTNTNLTHALGKLHHKSKHTIQGHINLDE